MKQHSTTTWLLFLAYLLCIPAANWLVSHFGTVCVPDGPCLIPVGFGLMTPSGVLVAGLSFFLRDFIQSRAGSPYVIAAICIGTLLSLLVSTPALAVASAAAFLLSEAADMYVYTPLRENNLPLAVFASGIVGAFVDSVIFLYIAFGSLDHIEGQLLGKTWVALATFLLVYFVIPRQWFAKETFA